MKLKRNCLFFNADTADGGRTPDWGHELGQGKGYLMKEEGCSEIINGMVFNQIKDVENFSYGSGGKNYEFELISVFNNIEIKIYDFEKEIHQKHNIDNPLIVIITKEISGTHIGRRTLKINKGFTYNETTNDDFYNEINKIITNPWFGYRLAYDSISTGVLTLTVIKAPQPDTIPNNPDVVYQTAKERKEVWNDLLNTYSSEYDSNNYIYETSSNYNISNKIPQNKIYYGAPGTGKSHKVNEFLKDKEEQTERVTFHPEYDYASFVGCYKPAMYGDDIKYDFVPQAFTNIYVNAWNDLDNDYYMVIEEINRGNCAEIFGDIFQLLDRSNDYKITPSKELKEYLRNKLNGNENIDENKLILPPNLNILATMNTSDQSLFPMDSAFKRRWDWEYVPINYDPTYIDSNGEKKDNESSKYNVILSDSESFSWLDFIKNINNNYIKRNQNLGMDKCIGNYFIKAKDNIITLEEFINKAIFYLWNDVFKDEDDHIFEENTFYEDFFPIETNGKEKVFKLLKKIGLNTTEKED